MAQQEGAPSPKVARPPTPAGAPAGLRTEPTHRAATPPKQTIDGALRALTPDLAPPARRQVPPPSQNQACHRPGSQRGHRRRSWRSTPGHQQHHRRDHHPHRQPPRPNRTRTGTRPVRGHASRKQHSPPARPSAGHRVTAQPAPHKPEEAPCGRSIPAGQPSLPATPRAISRPSTPAHLTASPATAPFCGSHVFPFVSTRDVRMSIFLSFLRGTFA